MPIAALKIVQFVWNNWTWLVPTLAAAGALAWGTVEHIGWEHCSAAAAAKIVAEQKAVLEQHEKDQKLNTRLINLQLAANERTEQLATHTVEVIRNVPVTTACSQSPAMRAADDGLLSLGFSRQARPAIPGAADGAAAPPARPRRRDRQRARGRAGAHGRRLHQARGHVSAPRLLRRRVHAAERIEVTE